MKAEDLPLAPLLAEVARLRAQADASPSRQPVLDQALGNLEASIEELQVASEELQVKNEELLLALADLDAERRRYRDLFDLAADGYLVTDAHDTVVEANRAAGELSGWPAESLLGRPIAGLIEPRSRREFARHLPLARQGRRGEAVLTLATRSGYGRLAHVRWRRADPASDTQQAHWTLTDLERPIFESEAPAEADAGLIRRWLGIYSELVGVTESLLEGVLERADGLSQAARQHFIETQVRPSETRLYHLRLRRDRWAQRHAELVGLEFNMDTGEVRYQDRRVAMTHREQQLLRFLVDRPGVYFPSRTLLLRAWHASYLSEEQLRTYIGRLRRKLEALQLPCELVTERPRGYALVFH